MKTALMTKTPRWRFVEILVFYDWLVDFVDMLCVHTTFDEIPHREIKMEREKVKAINSLHHLGFKTSQKIQHLYKIRNYTP